jgi:threonylcarbamoyladenosine tRNA methylthiotransferase MtaB
MRYTIKTLGCKVNQIDSAELAGVLEDLGFVRAHEGEPAEVCVLNTCSVTGRTETECRQMIRRLIRENPGARIVVTGCYAETAPDVVGAEPGVDRVMSNSAKRRARSLLRKEFNLPKETASPEDSFRPADCEVFPSVQPLLQGTGNRSRAFIRVQDGCEAFCSYCIVPLARGPYRSEDPDRIIRQVEAFVRQGYPEIVLSGIHLGAYGVDRQERGGLSRLLERLVRISGNFRIRLSSLEPMEVDEELIELLSAEEKICNSLHIPLQSGDDPILERMKRPYTTAKFADLVLRLRQRDPTMAIGTDLIAGFPGETERSFERTVHFLSDLPLTHFHVFPYSVRPGTEAASFEAQVGPMVKKGRCRRLRELGKKKNRQFLQKMVGRSVKVVPIGRAGSADLSLRVLTGNYLPGRLVGSSNIVTGIFVVKVLDVSNDMLLVRQEEHNETA